MEKRLSLRRGKFGRTVAGARPPPPVITTCRNSGSGTSDGSIAVKKRENMKSPRQDHHPPRYNPRKTSHRSHFLRITPLAQFCAIRTTTTPIILQATIHIDYTYIYDRDDDDVDVTQLTRCSRLREVIE